MNLAGSADDAVRRVLNRFGRLALGDRFFIRLERLEVRRKG